MAAPRLAMIVDDDPGVRALLHHVLQRRGFAVLQATDGDDALRRMKSLIPDLIFLDLRMPGTDGWATVGRLRESERTRHIPVIAMSAVLAEEDRRRLDEAGFVFFLEKPFQLSRAEALIEECLRVLSEHGH